MRNDKPIRACKACGLAFLALSPKRIYCSAACRKAAEVKRQPRRSACEHCGQAFATKQSRRRFCSPRCQTNAAKKRLYPRRPPREIKCERCGKVFLARGPSVGPPRAVLLDEVSAGVRREGPEGVRGVPPAVPDQAELEDLLQREVPATASGPTPANRATCRKAGC